MPNQFFSPEGDVKDYFVTEYWLIDQYIGDQLWTWGVGGDGRLGTNDTTTRSTPTTTFLGGTNWKQVSCGYNTAAIKTDGTLWTWGPNSYGPLGTNDITTRITPVTTFAGGTDWKQVSCGLRYIASIKTDGTLWAWGNNYYGQLGTSDTTTRLTPVTTFVGGADWKQVSCGEYTTAAVKTDGTLWVWGNNAGGQLGTNDISDRNTPITTFAGGTDWKQVSSGNGMTAAIKTDGTLWTWGVAIFGKLGNNNDPNNGGISNTFTPATTFSGGTNWKQVSCYKHTTTAIKTDGTLWTWGLNSFGALGTDDTTTRSTPVTTFSGGTNWKQVNSGESHTEAIKTDGTLWAWGNNSNGQLGTNDTTNRLTPITTFSGGTNWKQVNCGNNHTVAVESGTTVDLPIS